MATRGRDRLSRKAPSPRRPPAARAGSARAGGGSGVRFRFFGGKGGVGKTTLAAARALELALGGASVLVLSTDPAHSLGDALGRPLGARPRRIATRRGRLEAAEIDAGRALERWLGRRRGALREIALRGTYLEGEDVDRLLDLALPGVDELMGLLEVRRMAFAGKHDAVVVDTAPTGHTLRLLATPATLEELARALGGMQARHRFLAESLGGRYREDRCDALVEELAADARDLAALLADGARAAFTWVLLPERLAVEESIDAVQALGAAGIHVAEAVVNRVLPAAPGSRACPDCAARRQAERAAIDRWTRSFPRIPTRLVAARAQEPRGSPALRALAWTAPAPAPAAAAAAAARGGASRELPPAAARSRSPSPAAVSAWLDAVAPDGVRLLFFGGKGGVGKTTAAAATAIALAEQRRARVLLLSTDPAHSLGDVLALALDDTERKVGVRRGALRAREIDAAHGVEGALERHRDAIDALLGGGERAGELGLDGDALLELLRASPPGLDEVLAVMSLVDALVAPGERAPAQDVVVVDTAPTGHALRLLALPEQAQEWLRAVLAILLKYREVTGLGTLASELLESATRLRALRALLASAAATRFVAVTRAEALPRLETERLLERLVGLRVKTSVLLVNAITSGACAACRGRARGEQAELRRLGRLAARRRLVAVGAPARFPPPRGVRELRAFGGTIASLAPAPPPAGGGRVREARRR